MSEQPSRDLIPEAYAKLYEPYKQKADGGKLQSLYDGYEHTQSITKKLEEDAIKKHAQAVIKKFLEITYPPTRKLPQKPKRKTVKEIRIEKESQEMVLADLAGRVPLRNLLRELFSGNRDWSRWLKNYNEIMDTKHPDYDESVSKEEASLARKLVRKVLDERSRGVTKAQIAGGKAGLKNIKAKDKRSPS